MHLHTTSTKHYLMNARKARFKEAYLYWFVWLFYNSSQQKVNFMSQIKRFISQMIFFIIKLVPDTDSSVGNLSCVCKYTTQIWYQRGNLNSKLHLTEVNIKPYFAQTKYTKNPPSNKYWTPSWFEYELKGNQQIVYDWR